jgi:hypothetical protein
MLLEYRKLYERLLEITSVLLYCVLNLPRVLCFYVNPITPKTKEDLLALSEQLGSPCFFDDCPDDEFDDVAEMLAKFRVKQAPQKEAPEKG